jgi:hypothetical protein
MFKTRRTLKEAPPGFEPGMADLQAHPLRPPAGKRCQERLINIPFGGRSDMTRDFFSLGVKKPREA